MPLFSKFNKKLQNKFKKFSNLISLGKKAESCKMLASPFMYFAVAQTTMSATHTLPSRY
jgi:hypothetical protein